MSINNGHIVRKIGTMKEINQWFEDIGEELIEIKQIVSMQRLDLPKGEEEQFILTAHVS